MKAEPRKEHHWLQKFVGEWTFDGEATMMMALSAGYTIIQVKSKQEAIEWAKRFPNPHGEGGKQV